MKSSIRKQIMGCFLGLVLVVILMITVVNAGFLERYYRGTKVNDFHRIQAILEKNLEEGTLGNGQEIPELANLVESTGATILVIDSDYNVIYMSAKEWRMVLDQLQGYLYDKNQQKVLDQTDNYTISTSFDKHSRTEYLEMWGKLGENNLFIIRSPIASIHSAVAIFNKFLAVVAILVVLVSIGLATILSKRLTEPILELAGLSQKMANLEFDAKYTGTGSDEIAVLGKNFNQMSETLEKTISDLKAANVELQKDIEKKEEIEEMRSEFLGNVSHELKTPIALIQGYAEGLKYGISDDPESREFYCDVIMDEAAKMNHLVKNLLELNQLEFGKSNSVFERFDIVDLIKGIIESNQIRIEQKGATIQFSQTQPVYVWADEFKIEQVVTNYFSNALNHLDGEKIIDIQIRQTQDLARISVFNTGKNIPDEDLDRIWDKFYKVDKARTREYGGNGIGLSIVKAIMESLQKAYGVKNYDGGVEFWFELDKK